MPILRHLYLRSSAFCRAVPVRVPLRTRCVVVGSYCAASAVALHLKPSTACDSSVPVKERCVVEEKPKNLTEEGTELSEGTQLSEGTSGGTGVTEEQPKNVSELSEETSASSQQVGGQQSIDAATENVIKAAPQGRHITSLAALQRCLSLLGYNAVFLLLSIMANMANTICKLKRPLAEARAAHSLGNPNEFGQALWQALVLMMLDQTFNVIQGYLKEKALDGFQRNLEQELVVAALHQDAQYFDLNDSTALASQIHKDAAAVRKFLADLSLGTTGLIVSIGGGLREIYTLSPALMCKMAALSVPVCAYFSAALAVWMRARLRSSKEQDSRNAGLVETFTNIRTVHSCCAEELEVDKYVKRSGDVGSAMSWERDAGRLLWNSANLVSSALHLSLLHMGSRSVQEGTISEADVGALFKQAFNLMGSAGHLVGLSQQMSRGLAAVKSVVEAMDRVPKIKLYEGIALDGVAPADINFDGVGFKYPSRPEDRVLANVSCCMPAGKMTAFVGQSGSGKSTMGLLTQRMYDPDEGSVRFGEHDLRMISPASLRHGMSYVEQEPRLFEGTIRENIQYGCSHASMADIEDAAEIAGVTDFAKSLPDGLDTRVGKFGKGLSGGQKQRVAIARAVVKKPGLLILDEATSALDVVTEQRLLASLAARLHQSTVMVIAHRLSTMRNADQIVVMEQGIVVEVGTHTALCANPEGRYASLVQQNSN